MKRLIIFLFLIFLVFGCAGKNKSTKSVYNNGINGGKSGKSTPAFSVFKGSEKGKSIKSESLEEANIAKSNEEISENEGNLENQGIVGGFQLRDIHFDFDSAIIKPQDIPYLESLGEFLQSHKEYKLVIEGHCDERGSEMYNLALGQRRAESVKKFLVNLGISPDRIQTISYGEEKPVDPRHNEEAWAKNRRCHFILEK